MKHAGIAKVCRTDLRLRWERNPDAEIQHHG